MTAAAAEPIAHDDLLNEYQGEFQCGRSPQQIIDWVQLLPPMPAVAARALRMVDDPDSSADQIAHVIEHDTSLACQLLRAANSAAAARKQQVNNLAEAIQVVGFRYIKGIVVASVTRRWNPEFTPTARSIWERSVGTAVATRILLRENRKGDVDQFYLPGLLHNLGQVVLLSHQEFGPAFEDVLKVIATRSVGFIEAEQDVIGFAHPVVGALVAQKWGFPTDLCRSILHYATDNEGLPEPQLRARHTLKLATMLCNAAEIGAVPGYPTQSGDVEKLWKSLGMAAGNVAEEFRNLRSATREQFQKECSTYN